VEPSKRKKKHKHHHSHKKGSKGDKSKNDISRLSKSQQVIPEED
jgi:hypothetical protein